MMKNMFYRPLRSLVLLCALCTGLASCATSTKHALQTGENTYYDSNISDFSTSTLSNGISVVFKQQAGNTAWIGIVIDGGVSFYASEKSGLEDITLSLMLHGSKNYPYSEIQRLQFTKSFSLHTNAGKDYATISARCISRDIPEVLALIADSLLHPLLTESDFKTVMTEEAEGVQRTLSTPSGVLGLELSRSAFAHHPYATSASPTAESLSTITLADIKKHYQTLLNARRLSIVAAGNFPGKVQKSLVALLESHFGTIPEMPYTKPTVPPLTAKNGAVYSVCDLAGDTGYIAGYFACPDRTSDDYVPFALAQMYLDDILFKQVREKHGAVYSIGSGVFGGRQLAGAISLYKATEKNQLALWLTEAIDSFPTESEIEKTLERYKNKYITTLFQSSQHVSGVAGNVVASLAFYGVPSQYLNRSRQVEEVTAADITRVYQRYLARSKARAENGTPNPICWIVVSGKEAVHDFKFD